MQYTLVSFLYNFTQMAAILILLVCFVETRGAAVGKQLFNRDEQKNPVIVNQPTIYTSGHIILQTDILWRRSNIILEVFHHTIFFK